MSKSRIGPEAKIITLFNSLSDDSKRIVLDVIKAQASAPRKASTKKQAGAPAQLPDKEAKGGLCSYRFEGGIVCSAAADNAVHDKSMGYAGYHPFKPSKSVARAPRRSGKKSESAPSIQSTEGETGNAMSASSGGD